MDEPIKLVADYEFENIVIDIFQYYGISYELEKTEVEMRKLSMKGYNYWITTKSNESKCESIDSLPYYDRYFRDKNEERAVDSIIYFCVDEACKLLKDKSLIKTKIYKK